MMALVPQGDTWDLNVQLNDNKCMNRVAFISLQTLTPTSHPPIRTRCRFSHLPRSINVVYSTYIVENICGRHAEINMSSTRRDLTSNNTTIFTSQGEHGRPHCKYSPIFNISWNPQNRHPVVLRRGPPSNTISMITVI
jgi:hypothetical protein